MSKSISDLQIDTSLSHLKKRVLRLQTQGLQKPFSELVDVIATAFSSKPFLEHTLDKNVAFLNELCTLMQGHVQVEFVAQEKYEVDNRSYEQIIFETKSVPTRPNWHDFFNGLIWSQFPKTKHYFNRQHMAEIELQGNTQRSPTRDRLTHFDECGIVLFTTKKQVATQLQNHQWNELFVQNSANWHQQTLAVIFGHALWEMLLAPFIGLTAKATVIEISDSEMLNLRKCQSTAQFYVICDGLLIEHLKSKQLVTTKKPWLPLPVLGIPQWSPFKQSDSFYSNTKYFMPKKN